MTAIIIVLIVATLAIGAIFGHVRGKKVGFEAGKSFGYQQARNDAAALAQEKRAATVAQEPKSPEKSAPRPIPVQNRPRPWPGKKRGPHRK